MASHSNGSGGQDVGTGGLRHYNHGVSALLTGRDPTPLLLRERSAGPGGSPDGCPFCPPSMFKFNLQQGLPGADSILLDTGRFIVVPDIAPLITGHVLIVSTRHITAMGDTTPAEATELLDVARRVSDLVAGSTGSATVTLFEHGARDSNRAGACIGHAHWHCLPGTLNIDEALEHSLGTPESMTPGDAVSYVRELPNPYLLRICDDRAEVYLDPVVPCQFLRSAVALSAGDEEWLWGETYGHVKSKERFHATLRTLSEFLLGDGRFTGGAVPTWGRVGGAGTGISHVE